MNLETFKNDLQVLDDSQLVNKYYHSGDAFALSEDKHFTLRHEISKFFRIEYTEVFLVGSAKLGFSIKPTRRFGAFEDTSDIDVVILSAALFESIWLEVYDFERNGGYWPKMKQFKKFHFNGWIRPDKLPTHATFKRTRQWWDFFESLSGSGAFGPYKIRGGLYYSRHFLERYQSQCFEQCRTEIA